MTRPGRYSESGFRAVATSGIWLSLMFLCASSEAAAQESASFKMKRLTVVTLADRLSSESYGNTITASEAIGSAGVCPSGTATGLGFFSLLGLGEVPILLTVRKNQLNADHVDLSWTGQAAGFQLYKSASPVNVASPGNLLVATSLCAATDSVATGSEIAFYLVSSVTQSSERARSYRTP